MKKILVWVSIFAAVISMTACGTSGVSQEEYDAVVAELEELKSKQAEENTEVTTVENVNADEKTDETADIAADNSTGTISDTEGAVEILAEYTYADSLGWYTYHFIVLKNNSDKTVDVSSSSIAYDAGGNVLGADDASFTALGAGCTSVMYEMFDVEGTVAEFETDINSTETEYYESVIQDLQYVQSDIANGAVFQVTNNGSEAAEFVEGYALFMKDGNLVGYDYTYFTDDDSEIKPGATVTKQLDTTVEFDSIQFYLTGSRY